MCFLLSCCELILLRFWTFGSFVCRFHYLVYTWIEFSQIFPQLRNIILSLLQTQNWSKTPRQIFIRLIKLGFGKWNLANLISKLFLFNCYSALYNTGFCFVINKFVLPWFQPLFKNKYYWWWAMTSLICLRRKKMKKKREKKNVRTWNNLIKKKKNRKKQN